MYKCTYLLPSNTSTVYLTSAKGSLFAKSLISDCVNINSKCCIRSQKFEISKQKQKEIRVGTEIIILQYEFYLLLVICLF